MLDAHAVTGVATSQWIAAGVALGTSVLVLLVIRAAFFNARKRRLAAAVLRGELTPEASTRLRLLERAVYALILIAGISIALSSFEGVRVIGRTLLTSGAIAAAVVGFAARQTLANVIAGILIAVTQPLRLGDSVRFEDHYGVVEDVKLSYTTLRAGDGTRIVIPNEKLASGVLRNDSLVDPPVRPEVSVWIAPDADPARAIAVLGEATGGDVAVAEATPEGMRLTVAAEDVAPPDRGQREAELRVRSLERLHADGLLPRG